MFCTHCGKTVLENDAFCTHCGAAVGVAAQPAQRSLKSAPWRLLSIAFIVFLFLVALGIVASLPAEKLAETDPLMPVPLVIPEPVPERAASSSPADHTDVIRTVVNIYCVSVDGEEFGGSGTILHSDGIVLTNSHVIPQNETHLLVGDEGCVVILPDPLTGQPEAMYYADPIVYAGPSDEFDLAFLEITGPYVDDEGESLGVYPRSFPSLMDSERACEDDVLLGESVRVYGYPSTAGGISLVVTDGIVSSFLDDGTILTSAKIDQGNSGGLAVDAKGCPIGVPSAVYEGSYESLGVIISMNLISDFIDAIPEE